MRAGWAAIVVGLTLPTAAWAGAWPIPPGETQAILKYEYQIADEGLDEAGTRLPIDERFDESVSLFVERGLTQRFTVQGKASFTRGEDGFVAYEGRGPVELGLRAVLWRGERTVVSAYVGGVLAGEGRNAGYATPGAGDADLELRLLAGRSATLLKRPAFAEVQIARLERQGLPDETHLDLTLGVEPSPQWLVLVQTYAGQADGVLAEPLWIKAEASVVRRFGSWRVQAGWRRLIGGREVPIDGGPVLALWRTF